MSETLSAAPAEDAPKPYAAEIVSLAKTIGGALLIALVLRVVLFQPFTIPSDSMEPGLLKGDYLIVSKYSYGWSRFSIPLHLPLFKGRLFEQAPHRGDVVVFSHQIAGSKRMDYVKRLIGLPGDQVQVNSGVVHINGKPVRQELLGPTFDPDDPGRQVMKVRESLGGKSWIAFIESPDHVGETTGVYVVPQGRYFLMGDNRDNSLDSRWADGVGMGFVPKEEVEGRARFILASWTGGAEMFKPWTWVTRLDLSRLFRPIR